MFDSLFFVATIQLTFLVDKLGRTLKGFFLVKYSASLPLSEAISVDASSVSSSVSPLTSRSSLVIASTKVCLLEDGTSPYTTLVACVESTPVEVVAITACRVEVEAPSLMDIVVQQSQTYRVGPTVMLGPTNAHSKRTRWLFGPVEHYVAKIVARAIIDTKT